MQRAFLQTRAKGRAVGVILILAIFVLPTSAVFAARASVAVGEEPLPNGALSIPTWGQPLDPNFTKWDNAPITYDTTNGAVEQGRFPDCKNCPPDETDYLKRPDPPCPDWPAGTTVKIISTWPSRSANTTECSGVLVDHSTVLTAAHCIFTHRSELCGLQNSCWAEDLKIFINYEESQEKQSDFEQILTWTAWTKNRDYNYDLAGVKLINTLGDEVCWLGFGYNNDDQFFLNNIFKHSHYIESDRLTTGDFSFDNTQEHGLFTNTPSVYGQAGAGAYQNSASVTVFSVLSHHHELEGETFTGHTRITPDKFFALRDWINGNIKDLNFATYMPLITD